MALDKKELYLEAPLLWNENTSEPDASEQVWCPIFSHLQQKSLLAGPAIGEIRGEQRPGWGLWFGTQAARNSTYSLSLGIE